VVVRYKFLEDCENDDVFLECVAGGAPKKRTPHRKALHEILGSGALLGLHRVGAPLGQLSLNNKRYWIEYVDVASIY
jgi:hypothetical protein